MLDGIRGLAIVLVMVLHFVAYIRPEGALDGLLLRVAEGGWIGVDLFFVLSGFLITGILMDARGSEGYFRNFYMRRVLRIFPLYYGTLFLIFGVMPLVPALNFEDIQQVAPYQRWAFL